MSFLEKIGIGTKKEEIKVDIKENKPEDVSAHLSVIQMHKILHKDNITNSLIEPLPRENAVHSANRV